MEVDGFDEFTADLHNTARLALPKPIARPFDMARDRARLFVDVEEPIKSHPVIEAHVREVLGSINTLSPKLPLQVEAVLLSSRGQLDAAIPLWEQAYREDPGDIAIAYRYADALADAGKDEELTEFVREAPLPVTDRTYFLLRAGQDQDVIDLASVTLAEPVAIKGRAGGAAYIRINRAIALKRLGRIDEMMADLDFLEDNGHTDEANIRAGVAALRGDKGKLLAALNESLHKTISPKGLRVFPVFEDYRNDPDIVKLYGTEVPLEGSLPSLDAGPNVGSASQTTEQ